MLTFNCVDDSEDTLEVTRDAEDILIESRTSETTYIYLSREDALKLAAWIQEQFDGNI